MDMWGNCCIMINPENRKANVNASAVNAEDCGIDSLNLSMSTNTKTNKNEA